MKATFNFCQRVRFYLSNNSDINFEFNIIVQASRLRLTANLNLYHVTKFPLYLLFTVHRSLKLQENKILSTRMV